MSDSANNSDPQQPLKDVILCSTSLTQDVRDNLAEVATQMGATCRLDLTSDITHLIVGQIDTPKYKHVAKERPDIYVLQLEWVEAVRQAWMQGGDPDIHALAMQYRLPTFYGLHVCVTGFNEMQQRQDLMDTLNNNGAIYHGDLTKVITHLIAAVPHGAKYTRAKQWGMKVVSFKWLQDSMQRGMALEESLYDPLSPENEQGRGAYVKALERRNTPAKRARDASVLAATEDARKRKVRRTASVRLTSQSQSLWADMSMGNVNDTKLEDGQWEDRPSAAEPPVPLAIEGDTTVKNEESALSQTVRRNTPPKTQEQTRGLFTGWACHATGHGEKEAKIIRNVFGRDGGLLVHSAEELYTIAENDPDMKTCLMIPSNWLAAHTTPLPETSAHTAIVTEWWLERCIIYKALQDPSTDILSQPLLKMTPTFFQGQNITISGLNQDVLHLAKAIRFAGGEYVQDLTPHGTSVLVFHPTRGNDLKADYAKKHKLPVVTPEWLWASLSSGKRQDMRDYRIPGPGNGPDRPTKKEGSEPQHRSKRKDNESAQRLSVTRKWGAASALRLTSARSGPAERQGDGANVSTQAPLLLATKTQKPTRVMPFMEDEEGDDVDMAPPPQPASQPLQDLPSNINSFRRPQDAINAMRKERRSISPSKEKVIDSGQLCIDESIIVDKENTGEDAPALEDDAATFDTAIEGSEIPEKPLSPAHDDGSAPFPFIPDEETRRTNQADQAEQVSEIRALLAARQQSADETSFNLPPRRRKDRKLGRAASSNSTGSFTIPPPPPPPLEIADSNMSASPITTQTEVFAQPSGPGAGVGMGGLRMEAPPMPSQQLSYEAPDAEEHRRRMSAKMGLRLEDETRGQRVGSVGQLKDAELGGGGEGVGGRVRGRQRGVRNT